ncbi:thiamine phosphate synthase [Polymorphum gilvum]|uniref:Thiamine-phosphate pyrophosphorylase ThiE1 n=1 Tax=Polymorphum gilvum (strain LMG 25793 / CGMCC 1.9160 / SL003B-26A1) TaxID=991905 RepID=F2IV12_POLGS|nr:thiamine phosphate synthase [Polymorphum gilvum]ADZ70241.1 Thiamine-phosphate pyrophosphorylase ThiE1 [Polymorphum gilvum SL003B-26A1]
MLDRFYLIVDSAEWLVRLLPAGLKLAQLRLKDKTPAEIEAEVRASLTLASTFGCQLVINDHWRTAIDAGAAWIHLGQEDLDGADLAAIRRAGLRLGISTHTEAELDRALGFDPDYVALGPIYEPGGKKVDFAPQGLARIGAWKARIACPLVAIGGLTLERAPAVYAAGADSLCVITDVLAAADPEGRCRAWLEARQTWTRG